jgi:hypothetical protein
MKELDSIYTEATKYFTEVLQVYDFYFKIAVKYSGKWKRPGIPTPFLDMMGGQLENGLTLESYLFGYSPPDALTKYSPPDALSKPMKESMIEHGVAFLSYFYNENVSRAEMEESLGRCVENAFAARRNTLLGTMNDFRRKVLASIPSSAPKATGITADGLRMLEQAVATFQLPQEWVEIIGNAYLAIMAGLRDAIRL